MDGTSEREACTDIIYGRMTQMPLQFFLPVSRSLVDCVAFGIKDAQNIKMNRYHVLRIQVVVLYRLTVTGIGNAAVKSGWSPCNSSSLIPV